MLKALTDEIERAENQMSIASTLIMMSDHPLSERQRWKKYIKQLYEMAAEISLLGLFKEEDKEDE